MTLAYIAKKSALLAAISALTFSFCLRPGPLEKSELKKEDTICFYDFEDRGSVTKLDNGSSLYKTTNSDFKFQFNTLWYSANNSNKTYQVPQNDIGFQEAHSGNSYVSLMNRDYFGSQRMILTFDLKQNLDKDSVYMVGFYVSAADSMKACDGYFDIAFSDEQVNTLNTKKASKLLQTKVSLENQDAYCSKSNWIKIETLYKATGNERYVYLGNLNRDRFNTEDVHVIYYLDDFSVRKF